MKDISYILKSAFAQAHVIKFVTRRTSQKVSHMGHKIIAKMFGSMSWSQKEEGGAKNIILIIPTQDQNLD